MTGRPPRRSSRGSALTAALALALVAGCGGGAAGTTAATTAGTGAPSGGSPTLTTRELAAGAGHSCIVAGSGRPTVDWAALRNPILSSPSGGVKDEALIWAAGTWHMLFSYVTTDRSVPGGIALGHRHLHQSGPGPLVGRLAVAPTGRGTGGGLARCRAASRTAGTWSPTSPTRGRPHHRAVRTACTTGHRPTCETWSAPRPLAQSLAPSADDRMIDGALAYTGSQLLLGFKYSSAHPARGLRDRPLDDRPAPGTVAAGRPARTSTVDGGTIENYEFVTAAGRWRLVATSNNLDQPWIFTLAGRPGPASGWLRWTGGSSPQRPVRAVQPRPGHLQHRVRACQFGLPLRRQLAVGSLLLPVLRRAATSSPSSTAGAMP